MKKTLRLLVATALVALAAPVFAEAPAKPAPAAAVMAKPALLDINSASLQQLQALKGVGEVRAKAIVAGRPYKGKDDLVQKKILSKSVYDGIKDQIIAKQK
ncbi:helix-hairpin-helix domain-containing protein [Rhodoblastus acidophilus]|uniref:Helix-hairpin-helix domain-containing protein n=1 Tax=Candidatus Rhodoblastus alkanivorans TaxID=2954117 RepID=A0ABS9Z0Y7_9HYPH|nr:helix-hairpin-helix domain-containing protein [Candidatus Rhodoblastus alkanivorans]MCI4678261.1 helix-hairpin-helix domain-containing protein [Candidatus Rhodoblastus alkanivorans]MCI4681311.1 helix-hairpin-helix domain-containing protein [Candidatus Rhodoblastus alkanivorans]MDI4642358.1 helix-hairpin-helix domain-containing protein [Rhodoblastus acidophilus]